MDSYYMPSYQIRLRSPSRRGSVLFFFFNDTATTEIYTLSLHDALPIWRRAIRIRFPVKTIRIKTDVRTGPTRHTDGSRSEEHTSELQSQSNLVCRLLLEKKKSTHADTNPAARHFFPSARPAHRAPRYAY